MVAAVWLAAPVPAQSQFDLVPLPVTGGAGSFAVGDIDRDGDEDIVWVETLGSSVVLVNEGQMRFTRDTRRLPGSLEREERSWLLGDVDGDGAPDIIATDASTIAHLWLNDGRGFFTEVPGALPSDFGVTALGLGDFDGDGVTDIAASLANGQRPRIELWRRTSGRFMRVSSIEPIAAQQIRVVDMNGDGRPDLLGSCGGVLFFPNGYIPLINSGSWAFVPRDAAPFNFYHSWPQPFPLSDFDGDGDLDLLDPSWINPNIWLNDGTGRLVSSQGAIPPQSYLTLGATVADFDSDADADIFFGNGGFLPQRDQLFLNDGRSRFVDVSATRLAAPLLDTGLVEAADLDGDGDADVVAMHSGGTIYRNMLRHAEFASPVRIGQPASLQFSAQRGFAVPGQVVLPALSTLPLVAPVVLPPWGAWHLSLTGLILLTPVTVPSPHGVASLTVQVPAHAGLVGQTVSMQALVAHGSSPATWRFTAVARAAIER